MTRSHPRILVRRSFVIAGALALAVLPAGAQQATQQGTALRELLAKETYVRPPAAVERIVAAPRHLNATLNNQSPDRRHFLELESDLPTVAEFGKAHYYLAGLQVDPKANRNRTLTTRGAEEIKVFEAASGRTRQLEVPRGATASNARWSPDGSQVAFVANFDDASHVYVADVASGKSRRLTKGPLLATLVTAPEWTAGGRSIAVVLVPDGRGAEPSHPAIETGPMVRMTGDAKARTRTYREWALLRDPHEREMLEHYSTGQLAVIDVKSGAVRKVGSPAMIFAVDPSPDGQYFRVTLMEKPFSYIAQYQAFAQTEQLWDASGKMVAELVKRPLREGDGGGGDDQPGGQRAAGDTLKRSFGWLPNGKGLYYLQQEPAPRGAQQDSATEETPGQGQRRQQRKDRLFEWAPPFTPGSAKALLESNNRIGDVLYSDDAELLFAAENVSGTGHVYAVYRSEPAKKYTISRVRGINASLGRGGFGFGGGGGRGGTGADSATFYQNPGVLMSKTGSVGNPVALLSSDRSHAYLSGTQHYRAFLDSAPRPFVDRVEIRTGKKERVFFSAPDVFERVTAPLDDDFTKAIVMRESPTMVPDAYLRDMKSGTATKLTSNRDFAPEVTQAQRKRIQVSRADGYKFWVSLTLPRDYRQGTRLPAMFWFYPYEYTDQASYDRTKRTENKNQFPNVGTRSMEILVTQGYAVVQPDAPIVGETGRMNDNYVSDLRNNLAAVIDELDRQGYIDRQRLGLGGHSYGAFSTVNAMVHTPFFRAGIAGDGAYNRTLTPNTFQSERRALWEARETYLAMSPFLYADRLTGALLLYHGLEDQNVGTDPINSTRLLQALQGMGKTASLYMYPYEDHGPATRETLLDLWARWTAWLDLHVKNGGAVKEKIALVP